ncbi:MAG TPA: ankyrin repeat domain-containing protein [Acidimicrobiales bacterium]|nr:ankyrin repeat domain-containing protein [Acidimicrobiales bacterium]
MRDLVHSDPSVAGARDASGVSALLFARYRNRLDIVDVLLAAGPPVDVFDAAGLGLVEQLAAVLDERPELIEATAADGFTPLQLTSFFGHPYAVRLLLDRGAGVGTVSANPSRLQALHSAAAGGHGEVVSLLLDAGADPDARQQGGFTPLMAAAARGDELLVQRLLDGGASPARKSDDGKAAADLAAERGHAAVSDRLRRLSSGR